MAVDMRALWLVILVILLIAEAVSMGLTTIWFAGGALTAFVLSILRFGIVPQFVAFCAISVVLLLVTRPIAVKWLNRNRVATNAMSLIGEKAVVTESIDNLSGTGQVQVRGQVWMARSMEPEEKIPRDSQVEICRISGVKLLVKEVKKGAGYV